MKRRQRNGADELTMEDRKVIGKSFNNIGDEIDMGEKKYKTFKLPNRDVVMSGHFSNWDGLVRKPKPDTINIIKAPMGAGKSHYKWNRLVGEWVRQDVMVIFFFDPKKFSEHDRPNVHGDLYEQCGREVTFLKNPSDKELSDQIVKNYQNGSDDPDPILVYVTHAKLYHERNNLVKGVDSTDWKKYMTDNTHYSYDDSVRKCVQLYGQDSFGMWNAEAHKAGTNNELAVKANGNGGYDKNTLIGHHVYNTLQDALRSTKFVFGETATPIATQVFPQAFGSNYTVVNDWIEPKDLAGQYKFLSEEYTFFPFTEALIEKQIMKTIYDVNIAHGLGIIFKRDHFDVLGDNFQFSPTFIIYAGNDMSDEVMKGKGLTEQKIGSFSRTNDMMRNCVEHGMLYDGFCWGEVSSKGVVYNVLEGDTITSTIQPPEVSYVDDLNNPKHPLKGIVVKQMASDDVNIDTINVVLNLRPSEKEYKAKGASESVPVTFAVIQKCPGRPNRGSFGKLENEDGTFKNLSFDDFVLLTRDKPWLQEYAMALFNTYSVRSVESKTWRAAEKESFKGDGSGHGLSLDYVIREYEEKS